MNSKVEFQTFAKWWAGKTVACLLRLPAKTQGSLKTSPSIRKEEERREGEGGRGRGEGRGNCYRTQSLIK